MKMHSGLADDVNPVPHFPGTAAWPVLFDCMLAVLGFVAIVTAPLLVFWAG